VLLHPIRYTRACAWRASDHHLPMVAFAHNESVRARLAFSWGIESAVLAPATTR
jgi:hypothetical protein